jgi:4-amino-4-deoxy-L-arabinose transferase-like glycosyltransferase
VTRIIGNSITTKVMLACLGLIFLFQSMFYEYARPITLDEATTLFWNYRAVHHSFADFFYEIHTTAYNFILAAWLSAFQFDLNSARGFSTGIAILTMFLVFRFARNIFDKRSATVITIIISCSPLLVHYSQHARTYALTIFAATASSYFYLLMNLRPSYKNKILYALSTYLMLCAHFSTFAVLAAQWVHVLVPAIGSGDFKKMRGWFGIQLVLVLAYIPIIWNITHRFDLVHDIPVIYSWVRKADLLEAGRSFMYLDGAGELHHYIESVEDVFDPLLLGPFILAVSFLASIGVFIKRFYRDGEFSDLSRSVVSYLLLWLLLPISLLFIYSCIHQSVFLGRGYISSYIPMAMLAGLALSRLFKFRMQSAIIVTLFIISNLTSFLNSTWNVEAWGSVVPELSKIPLRASGGGSILIIRPSYQAPPYAYLLQRDCFYARDFKGCLKEKGVFLADTENEILTTLRPNASAWLLDVEYNLKRNQDLIFFLKQNDKIRYLGDSEIFANVFLSNFTLR